MVRNQHESEEDLLCTLNLVGIFAPLEIPQSDVLLRHPSVVVRPVPLPAPAHNDDFGKNDEFDGHARTTNTLIEVLWPSKATSSREGD